MLNELQTGYCEGDMMTLLYQGKNFLSRCSHYLQL